MARKKSGLSDEGMAKARDWVTKQREAREAWERVEFIAGWTGQCAGAEEYIVHLARALIDLREKLKAHENAPAEDDVCPHGDAGCEASRAADAARAHALEDLEDLEENPKGDR